MLRTCLILSILFPLTACDITQLITPAHSTRIAGPNRDYTGAYPRFPHNVSARRERDVMLFHSPDDISATISWKALGYPDSGIFLLHKAFPELKTTLQIVPENRYLGNIPNRNIENDPLAAQVWRDLVSKPEFASWIEFGNHGYFHSPEGDPNLDHHEFNAADNPAANDSAFCYRTFARARKSYAAIGLDNKRITVMRFPGFKFTPMALQALTDNGFLAYMSALPLGQEGFEKIAGGREILNIPSMLVSLYMDSPELLAGLDQGRIGPANLRASPAYAKALQSLLGTADKLVQAGGIINICDHWWEHSLERRNGVVYRFELLSDLVKGVEAKYGDRIWFGFTSELARWDHMKKNGHVELENDTQGVDLDFSQPTKWDSAWAMDLSYTLTREGRPDFPAIRDIKYKCESCAAGTERTLNPANYWVAGNKLFFNFPFPGSTRVRIDFTE